MGRVHTFEVTKGGIICALCKKPGSELWVLVDREQLSDDVMNFDTHKTCFLRLVAAGRAEAGG